ncbi:hypothetical protein QTI66_21925 [Variovorax sp. J22R133]|uniref:hypothetical protein n=1 Tax=Variovorax brevis TaxID=3053503 RepID=UPI002577ACB5|nr:hypothetical protein [Variovorax sp. J22R133]MDM0114823.1 hypothetical protein [Variovorax sp. J22R133]
MRSSTGSISLQSGQMHRATVPAGTVVQVIFGTVRLQEPLRWLGETVFSPATLLRQGEAYTFLDGGWLELTATTDAQILQTQPVPALHALGQRIVDRIARSAPVMAFVNSLRRAWS